MPDSSSLIGRTISHYRVVETIGGGGMGIVYKAEDITLHRFVALKFLPNHLPKDKQMVRRNGTKAVTGGVSFGCATLRASSLS